MNTSPDDTFPGWPLCPHCGTDVFKEVSERDGLRVQVDALLAERDKAEAIASGLERERDSIKENATRVLLRGCNHSGGFSDLMEQGMGDCPICLRAELASTTEYAAKLSGIDAERDMLLDALVSLHAMVLAECPSLLNEDSGGDAELDSRIRILTANGKLAQVDRLSPEKDSLRNRIRAISPVAKNLARVLKDYPCACGYEKEPCERCAALERFYSLGL